MSGFLDFVLKKLVGSEFEFKPIPKKEKRKEEEEIEVVQLQDPPPIREDFQPPQEVITAENIKQLSIKHFTWVLAPFYNKHYHLEYSKKKVHLFQLDDQLYCTVKDMDSKNRTLCQLEREHPTIQEDVEAYKKLFPVDFDGQDIPTFSDSKGKYHFSENIEIYLLSCQMQLIFEIFQKNENLRHHLPLHGDGVHLNSMICHAETKYEYDGHVTHEMNYITDAQRINFLKKFRITKVDKTHYKQKPFDIYLEPINYKSTFDDHRVSPFVWGVTLITINGVCDNHVSIIIEGINKKCKYFMNRAALNGDQEVIYDNIEPLQFKYIERTQVWMVRANKVKEMIREIIHEKNNPDLLNGFSRLGRDSFFSGGKDSCFTWAREKIKKLDIDLGKSALGFIFTRPKNFTHPPKYYKNKKIEIRI